MGRLQKHYPKCWNCHRTFPHYLMKEVRVGTQRRHYCIPCDEAFKRRKAAGG
jgi:hypothetical protein